MILCEGVTIELPTVDGGSTVFRASVQAFRSLENVRESQLALVHNYRRIPHAPPLAALVVGRLGKGNLLGKITCADIERFQAERLSTPGKRKQRVKPATVKRHDPQAAHHSPHLARASPERASRRVRSLQL